MWDGTLFQNTYVKIVEIELKIKYNRRLFKQLRE